MGYYSAWGDTKIMYSSEEEDYENCASGIKKKRNHTLAISEKASSAPTTLISDDADQQFWAEDELSHPESLQGLTRKKKRRHHLSYKNRVNRSHISYSSNSNSDSSRTGFLSKSTYSLKLLCCDLSSGIHCYKHKSCSNCNNELLTRQTHSIMSVQLFIVHNMRRYYCRCSPKLNTEELQSVKTRNVSYENSNGTSCISDELVYPEYQTTSSFGRKVTNSRLQNYREILLCNNYSYNGSQKRTSKTKDIKKVRRIKTRGFSK